MSAVIHEPRGATIDDLALVEGKAELVNGEIVHMAPCGDEPSSAGLNVTLHLKEHQRRTGAGRAYTDNIGYAVDLPRRRSFSPDASYYFGPRNGMRFLSGPPAFAVEVRSEHDYGPRAERDMRQKRADYFSAGTTVVWDVDLRAADPIRKFTAELGPDTPSAVFGWGGVADAEPAVRGWTMPVDDLRDEA